MRFFELVLDLDYLQQRWDEGEHNAKILHQELVGKGYLRHYQRVKMALAPLRRGPTPERARERPPSPREAARWIITAPDRHGPQTAERLRRPLEHCPELKRTHDLVREFAARLDTRDATPLPDWLSWLRRLTNSGLTPLARIATALREDQLRSPRASPRLTTPESTRAESPTWSFKSASWEAVPASRSCVIRSY
ncbi:MULTISPECIES: hypothetical protein [Streptomyces]|uniref:hypothetical protein n=1 Tax=Streptomyces TaxID=1883 RepID=UPI00164DB657|nr:MULTISPECIES: hypothetical protein [Streptomyces]MCZ4096857.1 hypothetical protein [Streptomyces sp. H39-C1]